MTTFVKPWMILASLLLNAALIGFLGAQGLRAFTDHRPPMSHFGRPPMDRDDAHAILDRAFASEKAEIDSAMQAMEIEKRKVEALLKADPVDQPAFEAAMSAMQGASVRAFAGLDRSLRAVAKMDAKERQAIADALSHMPPPGPPGPRMPGHMQPHGPSMPPPPPPPSGGE